MPKKLINIGIIGLNFAVNVHLPAFKLNKNCKIYGIVSKNITNAKLIAKQYNIPNCYTSWQEMILDPQIDAISIAVPPILQPKIIIAALKQHKAIFAEKPLASKLVDTVQIDKLIRNNNIANIIDFSYTGCPAFMAAKKLIQNKFINNIRSININWHLETKSSLEKNINHWKTKPQLGGGVTLNFASHVLFYLEWLFGKINKINFKKYNLLGKNHGDTLVQISAELNNNIIANIIINIAAFTGSKHEHKIEIYGDNASMILENTDITKPISGFNLKTITRNDNKWHNIKLKNSIRITSKQDDRIIAVNNLTNKFIKWIMTNKPEHPNFTDGIRIQKLLESY